MAAISSNGTGGGKFSVGASWGGGVKPGVADTFTVLSGDVIDCDTTESTLGGTVNSGGELQVTGIAEDLTFTTMSHTGKITMPGSGDNANPTYIRFSGSWTVNANAEFAIDGTDGQWDNTGNSDIIIVGSSIARLDAALRTTPFGTIRRCRFNGFTAATQLVFYRFVSPNGLLQLRFEDIYLNVLSFVFYLCQIEITGEIIIDGCNTNDALFNNVITGDSVITIKNSVAISKGLVKSNTVRNTTKIIKEDQINSAISANNFMDDSELDIQQLTNSNQFSTNRFLDNSKLTITHTNNNLYPGRENILSCDTVNINYLVGGQLFVYPFKYEITNFNISLSSGTLVLGYYNNQPFVWIMSRTKYFKVTGATAITLNGTASAIHFEPVAYNAHLTDNLMSIQSDFDEDSPNYADLYEYSGWTPSTKTLATAGYLKIKTVGWHDTPTSGRTGMNVALSDLSLAAHANTGTFVEGAGQVITYRISRDGGTTWSAEITLATLQTNQYTIGGDAYILSAYDNVQIETIYRNTSGASKTITQVTLSGLEFDPDPPTSTQSTNEQYAAILDAINAIEPGGGGATVDGNPYMLIKKQPAARIGVVLTNSGAALTAGAVGVNVEILNEDTGVSQKLGLNMVKGLTDGYYLMDYSGFGDFIKLDTMYSYIVSSGTDTVDISLGSFKVVEEFTRKNILDRINLTQRRLSDNITDGDTQIQQAIDALQVEKDKILQEIRMLQENKGE